MHACFFCQQPLVLFKNEKRSGNYSHNWTCYECGDTNSCMNFIEIRNLPYVICVDKNTNIITTASLFFKKSKIWLETFYFGETSFTDIKEDNWIHILRIHRPIDLSKYTPETLEDRVKKWIIFS